MSLEEQVQNDISKQLLHYIGGIKNIKELKHCSSRLRLIVKNKKKVSLCKLKTLPEVTAAYLVGVKLQIFFKQGTVSKRYEQLLKYIDDNYKVKEEEKTPKIKGKLFLDISNTFQELIPYILLSSIVLGLTDKLGNLRFIDTNMFLSILVYLIKLASVCALMVLPMLVCFITTKNYGGRPILGLVIGALLLDTTLLAQYKIGIIGMNPKMLKLGIDSQYTGFQGNIIIAFLMGILVAYIDKTLGKRKNNFVKNFVSPVIALVITSLLLFGVIGKILVYLENTVNLILFWSTQNLGAFGYSIFSGFYEIVRILGFHHIIYAAEATLAEVSGRNFIGVLVAVSLAAQAGALAGYTVLNKKDSKVKAITIPGIFSILLGVPEPILFGINIRYKYTILTGSIASAIAGVYVYKKDMAFVGREIGNTTIEGDFMIAGIVGFIIGMILTIIIGNMLSKKAKNKRRTIKRVSVEDTLKDKAVKKALNKTMSNDLDSMVLPQLDKDLESSNVRDDVYTNLNLDMSKKRPSNEESNVNEEVKDLHSEFIDQVENNQQPDLQMDIEKEQEENKIEEPTFQEGGLSSLLSKEEREDLVKGYEVEQSETDIKEEIDSEEKEERFTDLDEIEFGEEPESLMDKVDIEKPKNETLETYLSTLKKEEPSKEEEKCPSQIQQETESELEEQGDVETKVEENQELVDENSQEIMEAEPNLENPQEDMEAKVDLENSSEDEKTHEEMKSQYKNGVSQGAFFIENQDKIADEVPKKDDISKTRLYNREQFLNQLNSQTQGYNEEFEEVCLDEEEEKEPVQLIEDEEILHPNIDKDNLVTKEEMYDLYAIYGNKADDRLDESLVIRPSIVRLISPMEGEVRDVKECQDPAFSTEKMGKGIVITPKTGVVIAPANGRVEFIFPSHHAIGLSLEDGSRMLIHCGINTINLNGRGFEVYVREKEKINQGQRLMAMDVNLVKSEGYSTESVAVISEAAPNTNVVVTPKKQIVISIK